LAFDTLNDREEALRALTQALTLAEREGYLRVFIDEGAALEPLLRDLTAAGTGAEHASRVLSALSQR
jgi:LuxR family maltose regulon positive regulatory protein